MKAVVICCDRIPTRLIGCYGSELVETPALDRLAANGVVFDGLYATSMTPGIAADEAESAFGTLGGPIVKWLSDRSIRRDSMVATNDDWETSLEAPVRGVADVPLDRVLSDPFRRVPGVGHPDFKKWVERWRRQLARDDAGAQSPDACESLFASAAATWDEHADDDDLLLWLDVALAEADWIPPRNWRDRILADSDAPAALFDPVPGRVGELYSRDDVERVAVGWANRLAYFDALLGAFLQSIEETSDVAPMTAFLAEQGEPLGEHGVIGPLSCARHQERIHLPLIVKHPDGAESVRRSELTTPNDFLAMLARVFAGDRNAFTTRRDAERWFVHTRLASSTSFVTRSWKLLDDGDRQELYSRPEDPLDMNDVSNRSPTEVEELCAALGNLNAPDEP